MSVVKRFNNSFILQVSFLSSSSPSFLSQDFSVWFSMPRTKAPRNRWYFVTSSGGNTWLAWAERGSLDSLWPSRQKGRQWWCLLWTWARYPACKKRVRQEHQLVGQSKRVPHNRLRWHDCLYLDIRSTYLCPSLWEWRSPQIHPSWTSGLSRSRTCLRWTRFL